MGHDDDGQFEWVNAWAEAQWVKAADVVKPMAHRIAAKPAAAVLQRVNASAPRDQLIRDLVEITRTRDALASMPVRADVARQRTQARTLVPPRTTDAVPVLIGGVMALVLLVVFGAAASMGKLAR